MKLSVSLPDDDVEFLDRYAREQGIDSRSAAVHRAVRLLRSSALGGAYEAAWNDWEASGEGTPWEGTVEDGLGD